MLKFLSMIALIIIMPCSSTLSASISMSMPNGQPGIATGYSLDGPSHVETILAPSQGFMEETGACQGTCASWIRFGMTSPHGVITHSGRIFLPIIEIHPGGMVWGMV